MTTYAKVASKASYLVFQGLRTRQLGIVVTCRVLWRSLALAARLMDDILTPIPIDIGVLEK